MVLACNQICPQMTQMTQIFAEDGGIRRISPSLLVVSNLRNLRIFPTRPPYFRTENRYENSFLYVSPGLSTTDGYSGRFGESG